MSSSLPPYPVMPAEDEYSASGSNDEGTRSSPHVLEKVPLATPALHHSGPTDLSDNFGNEETLAAPSPSPTSLLRVGGCSSTINSSTGVCAAASSSLITVAPPAPIIMEQKTFQASNAVPMVLDVDAVDPLIGRLLWTSPAARVIAKARMESRIFGDERESMGLKRDRARGKQGETSFGLVVGKVPNCYDYVIVFDDGHFEKISPESLVCKLRQQLLEINSQLQNISDVSLLRASLRPDAAAYEGNSNVPATCGGVVRNSMQQQHAQSGSHNSTSAIRDDRHQYQVNSYFVSAPGHPFPKDTRIGQVVWFPFEHARRTIYLPGHVVDPDNPNPSVRPTPEVFVGRVPEHHLILSLDDYSFVWCPSNRALPFVNEVNFMRFAAKMGAHPTGQQAIKKAVSLSAWQPSVELIQRSGFLTGRRPENYRSRSHVSDYSRLPTRRRIGDSDHNSASVYTAINA